MQDPYLPDGCTQAAIDARFAPDEPPWVAWHVRQLRQYLLRLGMIRAELAAARFVGPYDTDDIVDALDGEMEAARQAITHPEPMRTSHFHLKMDGAPGTYQGYLPCSHGDAPMTDPTILPDLDHEHFLRRAFAVAERARQGGDHPFGRILVDATGRVVLEQGNGYTAEGGDMTAHAERLLATRASKRFPPAELAGYTMYTSAEPCAMCAGAVYWAGIGRVVYGQSEHDLKAMTGNHPENPTLDLPCRTVFDAGQRRVAVIGPLLEAEAAELQRSFWAEGKA